MYLINISYLKGINEGDIEWCRILDNLFTITVKITIASCKTRTVLTHGLPIAVMIIDKPTPIRKEKLTIVSTKCQIITPTRNFTIIPKDDFTITTNNLTETLIDKTI